MLRQDRPSDDAKNLVFACRSHIPPAIPDGDQYQVSFIRAEHRKHWGGKVYLWFKLITPGEWCGEEFYMACSMPESGRLGPSSKFYQAYVLAHGQRPKRVDRLSTAVFKNKVFRVRMRQVLKTVKQTKRTEAQRYSVIDDLLEILAGSSLPTETPNEPPSLGGSRQDQEGRGDTPPPKPEPDRT